MRIFEKADFIKPCPICGLKTQGQAVLIQIYGTEEDNNVEAELFHFTCINLTYVREHNILVQELKK